MIAMRKYSVIFFVFFCMCSGPKKDSSPVVAKVGNKILTLEDFDQIVPEDTNFKLSEVQIQKYVQKWVETELVYQEALRRKIDNQPKVKSRLKEIAKDFIVGAYLEQFVDRDLTINDDEIEKFYLENSGEFVRQETLYHLQLVLVETRTEANKVRRQLLAEDFETVAQKVSKDASKENGGNYGWVTVDELPKPVADVIPSLSINNISRPIRTSVGYYLIKIFGVRKEGEIQTLEEVKDQIEWRLFAKKRGDKYHRLITLLSENAEMEMNWDIVKTYVDSFLIKRTK